MIPDHLVDTLSIGSIVRVPLSGRRVRGWVVNMTDGDTDGLKDIAAISGASPIFNRRLLETLEWAAHHYVAPLSVLLAHAAPPNLPKARGQKVGLVQVLAAEHPLRDVAEAAARGQRQTTRAIVGDWTELEWLPALTTVLAVGGSVAVIAGTAAEVERIGASWARLGRESVVVAGGTDADITLAWEEAQTPGKLVVGTPRIATWQIEGLALVIVLEEGRRAMKERQTPTLHVREVIRKRSLVEGFALAFFGPTPSVEVLAAGAETTRIGSRAWPLVEVVDRAEDPPGSGFLSDRVIAALKATIKVGARAFVFTHRRVGYASMRCTRCRTVRRCGTCGTRLGRVEECPRCSARIGSCRNCGGTEFEEMGTIPARLVGEINGRLDGAPAEAFPAGGPIWVGTERDLASLPPVSLVVAADVDGMLMSHGYRASEEALRQLARLANTLEPGRGRRMMVQTSNPDSDLVATLRRGDPIPYLEGVLVERARGGVPPSNEMIAVEVRGDGADIGGQLVEDPRYDIIGPLRVEDGSRWLLHGDLATVRGRLRPIVGRLREKGAAVRVDADPIDL